MPHPKTAEVVAYLNAGHTYREVSAHFGIPRGSISAIARRSGIIRKRGNPKGCMSATTEANKTAVLAGIDAGHTWSQIAIDLGMTKQNVSRIAIANGRRRKRNGLFV